MRETKAVIRLIICYLLTFVFLGYLINGLVTIVPKTQPTFSDNFSSKEEKTIENEKKEEKKEEKITSSVSKKENSSVETSVSAIKGKIVTRYISPYSAPQSYNSVYLKNSSNRDINIKKFLDQMLTYKIEKNSDVQVLIMHTHTTESFMQNENDYYTEDDKTRTIDNGKNMVKIGKIIAEKLNKNGIKTVHDTTKHDYPEYTGSYSRSAKTIRKNLEKYPSIKVVLDLHRDSVSDDSGKAKLVTEIGGKKAAQVMLVMGVGVGDRDHPNWAKNMSLAVKFHQKIEKNYPTLARPILVRNAKYNQDLTSGSMLLEVGTEANTQAEAEYSATLVADALIKTLEELK